MLNKGKITNVLLENLFDGRSQTFPIKIPQLKFRNQNNQKHNLKMPSTHWRLIKSQNSNREPITTFNRFDCISKGQSLNETPEANDSIRTNEKLFFRKSGKSDTKNNI